MPMKQKIREYFTILNTEDIESLFAFLDEQAVLITPLYGKVKGRSKIKKTIVDLRAWLMKNNGKVTILRMINSPERLIIEFDFKLPIDDKPIEVPVATVLDFHQEYIINIRAYHSIWPITGRHKIIEPLNTCTEIPVDITILQSFFTALSQGDISTLLSLFEDDAYIQEAGGFSYKHKTKQERETYFTSVLAQGPLPLKFCSLTVDNTLIGVEYQFDCWGTEAVTPQAGLVIFDISKNGKIQAIRFYDEVLPFQSE